MPSISESNGQNGAGEKEVGIWPFDGPRPYKLSPEELDWLREQWDKEDKKQVAADLRHMLENGGLQLAEFLPELRR